MRLFERACVVTVETKRGQSLRFEAGLTRDRNSGLDHRKSGLDVAFQIEKSLKEQPNTCELTIWNLNETHRSQLEQLSRNLVDAVKKTELEIKAAEAEGRAADAADFRKLLDGVPGILCRIEAGYREGSGTIWSGDLREVGHVHDGTDWVTTISSGDGGRGYQGGRIKLSSPRKGADIEKVFRDLVRALGVDEGNVGSAVAKLKRSPLAKIIKEQGIVIYGPAARELSALARSVGMEWSIQDGAFQLLERGKALGAPAVLLSRDTGMIGSPSMDNDGILTVRSLIIPDIRLGGRIQVESKGVKGTFRVVHATWTGDTAGDDWFIEMEAQRY